MKYVTLQGVNTSATSGVVLFSTTTGANGNDNNTIDNCRIGDGASTPTNVLYSLGSTGTGAQANSGNTVSNCNLFNFYAATAIDSAGVRLDGGNTDWTVSSNSFYQTATRAPVAASVRAVYVNSASGNNFIVTNNSIGGGAPNAGSSAWAVPTPNNVAYRFVGILLNVGTSTPSSVQGNTVTNFSWRGTGSGVPGPWAGIYVAAGLTNIGTTAGNTIGSGTGTGAVTVNTPSATTYGIVSASPDTVAIANNTVGSMDVNHTTTTASGLVAIQVSAGTNVITNNTVGSATTANSLNATGAATGTTTQQVNGISSSSPIGATITNNTVANVPGVSNARTYQNNIFVNARSNSGGTGKHYAVVYGGTTVNPTGLTAGGNLFHAPNTASGGVFGLYNSLDRTTLADWQSATGVDANSFNSDPLYVNPTGTSATVDLHLSSGSPANDAAIPLATVTDDYDLGTRSTMPEPLAAPPCTSATTMPMRVPSTSR